MNKLLIILFISLIIKQLVWVAFVPLWHFPDEQAHFGQIAYSVEQGRWKMGANLAQEILLSERIVQTERDWAGNNKYTYHPEYNINYSNSLIGLNEEEITSFPLGKRKVLEKEEATFYPPLYYYPAEIIYRTFYQQNLFVRVFLIRIINLFYFALFFYLTYKLIKTVFKNNLLTISGVCLITFQPMFSYVFAGINSDNLFNLLFLTGIYICIRAIKEGINVTKILSAIAIYFLAINTKPQGQIMILLYLFPLIYYLFQKKSKKLLFFVALIIISLVILIIISETKGHRFLPDVNYSNLEFADIANFLRYILWSVKHTIREVLPWYWGVFRWLSLTLPRQANRIINRILIGLFIGVFIYLIKIIRNRDYSFKSISLGFFTCSSLLYFLIITFWDYLFVKIHGFSFGIQGRYFFPTIASHMGILLFGILGFSTKAKIQKILISILIGGTIALHEVALFKVLSSYFSTISITKFFIQASQYKPWSFKSPVLEFIILVHLITLFLFFYRLLRVVVLHEKDIS